MDVQIFEALISYENMNEFNKACFHKLRSFHWEASVPYRPDTYCKIGVVNGNLVACLKCYEENPRAVFENRDDPVYKDSCLEFFVKPIPSKKEYINFECNSKSVFLCEIGEGKYDRKLLKEITSLSPVVESFKGEGANGAFWGVTITLTQELLKDVYQLSEVNFNIVECNFYKCGDDCDIPHYIAYSPVKTLPPGFHNPDCFAKYKFKG